MHVRSTWTNGRARVETDVHALGRKRTSSNGRTRMERTQTCSGAIYMQSDRAATRRRTDEDVEERGRTDGRADGRTRTLFPCALTTANERKFACGLCVGSFIVQTRLVIRRTFKDL